MRVYKLDWDQGYALHPDERLFITAAMSIGWPTSVAEFFSPDSPLNPHMFNYGSLPVYVYRMFASLLTATGSVDLFSAVLFGSRLISALLSVGALWFVYKIGREFFGRTVGLLALAVFTFFPASIQFGHFSTTETWLMFLVGAVTYYSLRLRRELSLRNIVLTGVLAGLSMSVKIVGVTHVFIPGVVLSMYAYSEMQQHRKVSKKLVEYLWVFVATITLVYVLHIRLLIGEVFTSNKSFYKRWLPVTIHIRRHLSIPDRFHTFTK
jgi:4-amino-4-deoxy-L-arabinose transferase-like glycosyltransferase